jgi:hypothetical protein
LVSVGIVSVVSIHSRFLQQSCRKIWDNIFLPSFKREQNLHQWNIDFNHKKKSKWLFQMKLLNHVMCGCSFAIYGTETSVLLHIRPHKITG